MGLRIYKRGQGWNTRLWTGVALVAIVGLGSYKLHGQLVAATGNLWVQSMVPAAVFVALAVLIYWLLNRPAVADFLVAAEGELRKVNWPSRQEVVAATVVVVVVVLILAAILGVSDMLLRMVFDRLL